MSRKRYTPEQIIHMLREAEVPISQGMTAADAARQIGVVGCSHFAMLTPGVVKVWNAF